MDKLQRFLIIILLIVGFIFSLIYFNEGLALLVGAFIFTFFFYLGKKGIKA